MITKIDEIMDISLLNEMIEKKYVNVQKLDTGDPSTDLWLLNYSKSCQINGKMVLHIKRVEKYKQCMYNIKVIL